MNEYTKGKLELNDIRPWEIWVGADIHIADVHGNHETRRANARELVRRWNAFEEGGLVEEAIEACKETQKLFAFIAENYKSAPRFPTVERLVDNVLAKAKPE